MNNNYLGMGFLNPQVAYADEDDDKITPDLKKELEEKLSAYHDPYAKEEELKMPDEKEAVIENVDYLYKDQATHFTKPFFTISNNPANDYYYLDPVNGPHTSTVIYMHGLGEYSEPYTAYFKEQEFFGLTPPTTRIVLPCAKTTEVTVYNKAELYSWFDIYKKPKTMRTQEDCMKAHNTEEFK